MVSELYPHCAHPLCSFTRNPPQFDRDFFSFPFSFLFFHYYRKDCESVQEKRRKSDRLRWLEHYEHGTSCICLLQFDNCSNEPLRASVCPESLQVARPPPWQYNIACASPSVPGVPPQTPPNTTRALCGVPFSNSVHYRDVIDPHLHPSLLLSNFFAPFICPSF